MYSNCSHPFVMADVLADVWDGAVTNIFKGLSIGTLIDALTKVLMNELSFTTMSSDDGMLDEGLTISVATIASGFVVPISYSADVIAGDWVGSVMELIDVATIGVISGIGVDMFVDVLTVGM